MAVSQSVFYHVGHSHKLLTRMLTPCCLNLPTTRIPGQINLFFPHSLPGIGYFCKRARTCSILKSSGAESAPNPDLCFLSSQCCDQLKPLAVRKLCPGREPRPSVVFTSWVFLTPGSKSSTLSWAMTKNVFCFVTNYCWRAILLPVTARTGNPPLHSFRTVFTIFFFFNQRLAPII